MREKLIEIYNKLEEEGLACIAGKGDMADLMIANGVTVLPCKLGDRVWAIRCYKGVLQPQEGIVNEMFFCDDMRLCIVVKHIARGEWGKTVFATEEEAQAAIRERMIHNA